MRGLLLLAALASAAGACGSRAGDLAESGILLRSDYVGEMAANPIGGIRSGAAYAGQLLVGADLDMDRLADSPKSQVHVTFTSRSGRSLARDAVGNSFDQQEVYGGGDTYRLGVLSWQQSFADDRLDILAGRILSGPDFGRVPESCAFQSNDSCPGPKGLFQNGSMSAYPAASWGARIAAKATPSLSFQAGLYQVDPAAAVPGSHSLDFGIDRSIGAYIPLEIAYRPGGTGESGLYKIGGYIDTSSFDDPYYDVAGGSRALTGAALRRDHGRGGIYAAFDQPIWRPVPDAREGVFLFGAGTAALSSSQTQSSYLQIGLMERGLVAARPADSAGFFIAANNFSSSVMNAIADARRAAGGSGRPSSHEIAGEINYSLQLLPGLLLRPNLQLILHPDQIAEPGRPRDIPDALVAGLTFIVGIPELLDLARTPAGN